MKHLVANVKNILKLGLTYETLADRDHGIPGIGLVFGFPGSGKSTAIAHLINRTNGVFLRANALWTPTQMIGALTHELGGQPGGSSGRMLAYCVEVLARDARPRAIFVDEADYVFADKKMTETLRDVHDLTGSPLVLIGMDGIQRKITTRPQFARRISQWCEFTACDFEDTRKLIDTVCEVGIADDLAVELRTATGGSIGLMTVGLARVEQYAKGQGLDVIDAKAWNKRKFSLSTPPKN